MKIRSAVWIAAGLALSLSFSSCTDKEPDDGDLMVFHASIREDIAGWDPATLSDPTSANLASLIHETLYQYAYASDRYDPVPLLAADLPKYSADRLTVTIPIRRGIRFHDDPSFKASQGKGRELKAQDFVYGWKRLALPSLRASGWWTLGDRLVGFGAFRAGLAKAKGDALDKLFDSTIEGLRAVDDHTLQLKLTRPYPQLLHVLAMVHTAPVPFEAVMEYGGENREIPLNAIGTGPFRLEDWRRGKRIVLGRNPTYHEEFYPTEGAMDLRQKGLLADAGKTLPFLDRVLVKIVADPRKAWTEFLEGKADLAPIPRVSFAESIVSQSSLSPALAAKGLRLQIENGATFWYLVFNMNDKLLGQNKLLRQAISSAINREKWIQIFTNGTGRKADGVLPPRVSDRPEKNKLKYDFDRARAKELLAKAGYPQGAGLPVLNFDLRGADALNRELGDFFTDELAAIGIQLNVIYNSFAAFNEKMKAGKVQIAHGGWTLDYPDPENVLQLFYGPKATPGPNESNFRHPEFDKLFEQFAVLPPGAKRAALVARMDAIVQEEAPWALGYYQTNYRVTQPWLLNFRAADLIVNKVKYLRVDRAVKKRYLEEARKAR